MSVANQNEIGRCDRAAWSSRIIGGRSFSAAESRAGSTAVCSPASLASGVARNFRHGVRQSVPFLFVHSRSAALPSRPYNQKTPRHIIPLGFTSRPYACNTAKSHAKKYIFPDGVRTPLTPLVWLRHCLWRCSSEDGTVFYPTTADKQLTAMTSLTHCFPLYCNPGVTSR